MNIKLIALTIAALVLSTNINAALVGRLAATAGGTDYQAYYDDIANLTWLADANAAGTHMNWVDANSWAAGLNVAGVTGWRLADAEGCLGGLDCIGTEMGNLFYNVLGGVSMQSITTIHNANYDLFSNVQSDIYWLATEHPLPPGYDPYAYFFIMSNGGQSFGGAYSGYYAWAMQSGDVGAVPVPAAVWLFGSGLGGLIGFAKRKRSQKAI